MKNLQFEDGKMIPASKYFSSGESATVELTDDENKMAEEIKASSMARILFSSWLPHGSFCFSSIMRCGFLANPSK